MGFKDTGQNCCVDLVVIAALEMIDFRRKEVELRSKYT
jgi:hypothetical protein